jgi:hypothetical protein
MDKLKAWLPLIAIAGYFAFLIALWFRHAAFEKNLKDQVDGYLSRLVSKPDEPNIG